MCLQLLLKTRAHTVNMSCFASPCRLTWVLSRCRSSRWTMPRPDTWPAPSVFRPCAQYHLISSALCVWLGTKTILLVCVSCCWIKQPKKKARIAYCALENRVVLVYFFIFFRKSKVASSLHGASGTISNNAKPSFYAGTCLAGTTSIIDNW